jgi:hypothetical protein
MAAGSSSASGFAVVQCLQSRPGSDGALRLLQEAAQQVAPLMLKRQWRVQLLVEFYPANPSLLGLNVNRREKICVRLRLPEDANAFFPLEHVVGTLLHELAHIVRGPHDAAFYKLLDELTGETGVTPHTAHRPLHPYVTLLPLRPDEWEGYMVRQKFGVGAAAAVPQVRLAPDDAEPASQQRGSASLGPASRGWE